MNKKQVTCYKCKKDRHYCNVCDKEDTLKASNKNGSSFLVLKEDKWWSRDIEEEDEEESEESNFVCTF